MSKTDHDKSLPEITSRKITARSRIFAIEQIDLTFSNGEKRIYERMAGSGRGGVMIVPFVDAETFLLVREYCAGTHSYLLGFPKGLVDPGETSEQAANRELQEEVGFAANSLTLLHSVATSPTFFKANMNIFLAQDLYPQQLEGDEPEPLEIIKWSIHDMESLYSRDDFTDSRSLVALLLVEKRLRALQLNQSNSLVE